MARATRDGDAHWRTRRQQEEEQQQLLQQAMSIERTRLMHADLERYHSLLVRCLDERQKAHKYPRLVLAEEQRLAKLVKLSKERAGELRAVYADAEGERAAELGALSGGGGGPGGAFAQFDQRLVALREGGAQPGSGGPTSRYGAGLVDPDAEQAAEEKEDLQVTEAQFAGEEWSGRFMDLLPAYTAWLNLPGNSGTKGKEDDGADDVEPEDYISYAEGLLESLGAVSIAQKRSWGKAYVAYVELLRAYLASFTERVHPLMDVSEEIDATKADFDEAWASKDLAGWGGPVAEAAGENDKAAPDQPDGIDLSPYETAEALSEVHGLEECKAELQRLGLKCGGSLAQRAERLFSTKGKDMSELPTELFAGNAAGGGGSRRRKRKRKGGAAVAGGGNDAAAASEGPTPKEQSCALAWAEWQIRKLCEINEEKLESTKAQLMKKQTRTSEELQAELQADQELEPVASDSDEEEQAIYNPKNLPLGWDGKPIPYWLYKLHGLNVEYSCEICGNEKYFGPRSYDRHFLEFRHTYGLKCLGVTSGSYKQFHGITNIEDAMSLFKILKNKKKTTGFDEMKEEEVEDAQGNVYTKKIYEDLKRQGLAE